MDIQRDSKNAIERGLRYIMDNNQKESKPQEEPTDKNVSAYRHIFNLG
jgi:hypothetical protein